MENENLESNKIIEDVSDAEEYKFNYNFLNTPWDDRSKRSKMGAIALLVTISAITSALVINNLIMHYRGFHSGSFNTNTEIDCNVVRLDDYPYAARIHLISSNELICVGAVVSRYSVLANELCLKSGPTRLRIGRHTDPRCKKGFPVDLVETIPHDGVITKNLVLLSSYENMGDCVKPIRIGIHLDRKTYLNIIGRSFRGGRVLSLQLAKYSKRITFSADKSQDWNTNKTITVTTLGKCPVRGGDLLVQKGRLFGLASTSVNRREESKFVYFANLTAVQRELQSLDAEIGF